MRSDPSTAQDELLPRKAFQAIYLSLYICPYSLFPFATEGERVTWSGKQITKPSACIVYTVGSHFKLPNTWFLYSLLDSSFSFLYARFLFFYFSVLFSFLPPSASFSFLPRSPFLIPYLFISLSPRDLVTNSGIHWEHCKAICSATWPWFRNSHVIFDSLARL